MAQWTKIQIKRENGETTEAQAPIIISASRSTDIPAFYSDWFFHRLKVGYSAWTNPFNGVRSFVSYEKCRFIVFWSKNPKPLLGHLYELKDRNIRCYIQYTLNDYEKEGLEKGVPPLEERIDTFKRLVDKLGKGQRQFCGCDQQANPKAYYGSHNSPTPSFAEWRSSSISPNVRFGEDLRL